MPSRIATGVVYLGDDQQAFGPREWNEVVLDGHWTAVDPTWNQTAIDATHVRLGVGTGTAASPQAWGLRIEVVEVRRR